MTYLYDQIEGYFSYKFGIIEKINCSSSTVIKFTN